MKKSLLRLSLTLVLLLGLFSSLVSAHFYSYDLHSHFSTKKAYFPYYEKNYYAPIYSVHKNSYNPYKKVFVPVIHKKIMYHYHGPDPVYFYEQKETKVESILKRNDYIKSHKYKSTYYGH